MRALLVLLLLVTALADAEPRPLRFSVIEGWAMPLARIEEGRLTGGILFELFNATAQQVGMRPDFHLMPRARIEQAQSNHSIDVRCYISPTWLEHDVRGYRWSLPLFSQRDLLVARNSSLAGLQNLNRESIGTVLGYQYPPLQALFASGRIQRDDARNQELVLKKLEIGRYRYALSSEVALAWFNRNQPASQRLHVLEQVDQTDLGCMVLDDPQVPTQAILDALSALKRSGEVERILAHYR
ncbi:substrate-binding periplasmic protein [Pseudomonas panipatensis]|uniref:substrate-binding periplasmic protein n=1 Tax=Pseudomonas panipatensis TaxID=428992 RepID=UPI0035B32462